MKYRVWVKKDVPNPDRFHIIETHMEDNIHLPKDYIDQMEEYPERLKRKALGKTWDNPIGLIFDNFDFDKHMVLEKYVKDIPNHYFRFRSLDHGFTNPTACLWFARAPDGTNYLYDMHYQAELSLRENADIIKKKSFEYLERGGVFTGNYGCRSLANSQATEKKS